MSAHGYRFGDRWCEIHLETLTGLHVAEIFELDPSRHTLQDLGLEIIAKTDADALREACAYLENRFGPRGEAFEPAPGLARRRQSLAEA